MQVDTVLHGDALEVLKGIPDNYVHSIVCDPPAGINFMSKDFDKDRGGRDQWIAWLRDIMIEAKRCLRPGGHALVWALPRTSHWTATALEDAGFEVRDCVYHLQGQGFPKSLNLGNGQGTALKPSVECWWLVRKPLAESSIAANVLAWGTGGLAIDACRVAGTVPIREDHGKESGSIFGINSRHPAGESTQGRWPSHLLLSHSIWCIPQGVKRVRGGSAGIGTHKAGKQGYGGNVHDFQTVNYGDEQVEAYQCHESCPIAELDRQSGVRSSRPGKLKPNGKAQVYFEMPHVEDGPKYQDTGGSSRYFTNFPPDDYIPWLYQSKASRAERNAGCEGLPLGEPPASARSKPAEGRQNPLGEPRSNHHPTVKSLALMRWLIRLITPPGGVVLDCFLGSGSTAVAAIQEGMHFIGIEQDASYVVIADARIAHARQEARIAQARREPAWLDEVAI